MESNSEDRLRHRAEVSGVVELNDDEVLQFIERNKAANTMRKTRSDLSTWWTISLVSGIPPNY
jgi:hypothetical protein